MTKGFGGFCQFIQANIRIEPRIRPWLLLLHPSYVVIYEGWNFNFGNAAVTFDTAHLQSSYFHRPSMYSLKLCRTRSQR